MGPEIAVARCAGAAGGQSGDRPRGHEQGACSSAIARSPTMRRALHFRILLAAAGGGLRSGKGQEAAGRGGLSPTASTPACCIATARMPTWPRCRSTISRQIGIRAKLQPIERAGFFAGYADKKYATGIIQGAAAPSATPRPGSRPSSSRAAPMAMAATPISTNCSRSRPTNSTTRSARAILEKMQQLVYEKAIYAPIWQLGFINGVGPRVGRVGVRPDPRFCLYRAVRGHHDQGLADRRRSAVRQAGPEEDHETMKRYIVRRVGYCLLSLFLLSLTIFFFVRVTGDPATLLVEPGASQADIAAIHHQFGLDRPLWVQYGAVHVEPCFMAISASRFITATPVMSLYLSRLPNSLMLAVVAMASVAGDRHPERHPRLGAGRRASGTAPASCSRCSACRCRRSGSGW